MRDVLIWSVQAIVNHVNHTQVNLNEKWVPARPEGFGSIFYRIKATWLVFTGKADAVIWPEGQ